MDITMDYFEGLEELFDQDITEDYLVESFNTGPIKFENILDDNQTDQFDSIVPEDISCFLDTEMNEENDIKCIEEDLKINLEDVLDGNNNTNEIDRINSVFDFDDLNPEVGDVYQIKQELKEFPEMESGITEQLDFLNIPASVNQEPFSEYDHLFTIEHASETVKKEQVSESDEGRSNKKPIGQNHKEIKTIKSIKLEAMDESSTKKKYSILPLIQADELDLKPKKGKHSPARKVNTKDLKAFQFCDLCPFKTKEKSIFRMHQTLVHKLDVTKCPKKTPQKSETIRKSYQPPSSKKSKVQESTRHEAVTKKLITANEFEKKLASGRDKFTNPSLDDSFLPGSNMQNGHHIKLSEKTQPNSFVYNIAPVNTKPVNVNPVSTNRVNFGAFSRNPDNVTQPNSYVFNIAPVNVNPVNTDRVNFSALTRNTGTVDPVNFSAFSRIIDTVAPVMNNHMPCIVPASNSYTSSIVPPNTGCLTSFVLPSTVGSNSFKPHSTAGLASFVPPSTTGLSSIAKLPKVSTTTSGQLLSAKPGIVRVASCKIISPAPRKFVSILPKGPQCLINRFQQPNGKNPHPNNGRLNRNSQERQRRNETKQALLTVKNLVPRLKFVEKPSQITILNETIKYVKYLKKEEQEDFEELEAQRKTFMKLKSKCKIFGARS